jgi:hypothetical protein
VLGEVGSRRSSLLRQALQHAAEARPCRPTWAICTASRPRSARSLRLPASQGRLLRQGLQQLLRQLPLDIPHLEAAEVTLEADALESL